MNLTGEFSRPGWVRMFLGLLVGAGLGLGLGAGVYLLLNPALEGAGGTLEDFQGLLWNVVPLCTAAGALVGYLWGRGPRR